MQVLKVLNNSLVFAVDDKGYEVVLMGKGIGYNKSIGYKIKPEDIEKVYILKDKEISKNIMNLASEIDAEYFILAKTIIDYAIEKYNMKLMEYIYLSLTDHIAFAIRRIKNGVIIPNLYNINIRQFNPQEYDIGTYAIELLKKNLHIMIPDEEIGNIAIHFINAQENTLEKKNEKNIIKLVNDILNIVKYNLMIKYNEQSIAYIRFVTHLQSFAYRLINNVMSKDEDTDGLYKKFSHTYPKELACVNSISQYISEVYGICIKQPEKLYLLIHIHKILFEAKGEKL